MLKKIIILFITLFSINVVFGANHQNSDDKDIQKILNYWFDYENQTASLYDRDIWWKKNEAIDDEIRKQFLPLRKKAIEGELNNWLNTSKGTLAYVILIDQFSRNMFRNSAQMYQYDELALKASKMAIKNGIDKKLSLIERVFLYLPLEHSENQNDQNQSVALFENLYEQTPNETKELAGKYLRYATEHQDIINKFNRFPHRNKILSRESSALEIDYLQSHPGY
jgi:uncharacterized protein (DUF924 family)